MTVSCGRKTVTKHYKGVDGESCSVTQTATGVSLKCPNGEFPINNGTNGNDGQNGQDGVAGVNGVNGTPGVNGTNGTNGVDANQVDLVEICPLSNPGSYMETLVRVDNGTSVKYMAFLVNSDFMKERLVTLVEGQPYTTTDGRLQNFKIVSGAIVCNL